MSPKWCRPTIVASTLMLIGMGGSLAQDARTPKHYDIAAFIWPSYHPDDRAKIFWPEGIGEWQTVADNLREWNKAGDEPAHPSWGYINEADPYVAAMEISAAADHGVNTFIFDWYWYDGAPFLEGHLDDGYLKARNKDRVKFYLMWANHDAGLLWDRRNADSYFTGRNTTNIWKGGVDREDFEVIAKRLISKYFNDPSYYKIDGRPVFMIYELGNLVSGLGGVAETKKAIDWFRSQVKAAGFPGLELQLSMPAEYENDPAVFKIDRKTYTGRELIKLLGFDSLTSYQFVQYLNSIGDYSKAVQEASAHWTKMSQEYPSKYYANVSVGWDASPRAYQFKGEKLSNANPHEFERALKEAKIFVDAHPGQAPLIVINSWNEWTEGSYLQPDSKNGYKYLDAVRTVFPPR